MPDPDSKAIVGFTPEGAKRVARAVTRLERLPKGGKVPPRPRYPTAVPGPGLRKAKTGAGGVPAMVGSNPNSATVTLRRLSGTSLVDDGTVTCYSDFSTAVGANRQITIGFSMADGVWWVVSEDCP